MGALETLNIDYSALGDLLSIWAGKSKSGARVVTMKPDCSSFYAEDGKRCVGIYFYDAGRILLPVLERDDMTEVSKFPELLVEYCRDSDVLTFGNREESVGCAGMASGLNAHISISGLANRFTLRDASRSLLPCFRGPMDDSNITAANREEFARNLAREMEARG